MKAPVNFKDTSEEDYRLYRLLQAPAYMIPTYQERIKSSGKYRGAIIFPEQFVACYDNGVFHVSVGQQLDMLSVGVTRFRNYSLWSNLGSKGSRPILTMQDVIDIERDHADDRNKELFVVRRQAPPRKKDEYRLSDFIDTMIHDTNSYWFSNKADAISFARSKMVFPS